MLIIGLTAAKISSALRTWSIAVMPSGLSPSSLGEDITSSELGLVKIAGDDSLGGGRCSLCKNEKRKENFSIHSNERKKIYILDFDFYQLLLNNL